MPRMIIFQLMKQRSNIPKQRNSITSKGSPFMRQLKTFETRVRKPLPRLSLNSSRHQDSKLKHQMDAFSKQLVEMGLNEGRRLEEKYSKQNSVTDKLEQTTFRIRTLKNDCSRIISQNWDSSQENKDITAQVPGQISNRSRRSSAYLNQENDPLLFQKPNRRVSLFAPKQSKHLLQLPTIIR